MSELDFRKKLLINEFKTLSNGKSKEEILPLIMAVNAKAKEAGITFTKDDVVIIIEQVKDTLSEQERRLLPELLTLLGH